MAIDCEIIPPRNASPEQLKKLGAALAQWCRREDEGLLHFISRDTLANLANGKPPAPYLTQFENMLDQTKALYADPQALSALEEQQRRRQLKEKLGEQAGRRTVFFQVRGSAYAHRQRIIASLRQDILPELVADVLIDERSWDVGN